MHLLRIGTTIILALLAITLLTLRVTGFDPPYLDARSEEFTERGRTGYPGLWLSGEVVREPVADWDWINEVNDPVRGNTIMLETRTWYRIPHSVVINALPRGDKLYFSGSESGERLEREFPYSKRWWTNIERDPRVRMKIDGKIYEMTVAHIANREEIIELFGRDPVITSAGPDGAEQIASVRHYWRVFQRNLPDYGGETL
ncbi:MAG: hypothetical protein RL839_05560 [Gammaproteobacteria bacterium]